MPLLKDIFLFLIQKGEVEELLKPENVPVMESIGNDATFKTAGECS